MSQRTHTAEPSAQSATQGVLQRQCACGQHTGGQSECDDCRNQQAGLLQRRSSSPAGLVAAAHVATPQTAGSFGHDFSRVQLQAGTPLLQRAPLSEESPATEAPPISETPSAESSAEPIASDAPDAATATETPTATAGLIVEQDAPELGPGQMRKQDFLDQVHQSVSAVAPAEAADMIDTQIAYYSGQTTTVIEQDIQRYVPSAIGVSSAGDYVSAITDQVERAIAGDAAVAAVGAFLPSMFFKAGPGGPRQPPSPQAIQSQLGPGQSMDRSVQARMESALGYDLSGVRTHTDATAASLSAGVNARAFTIGSDVAFGAGQYQPGTPIGDALLAHELAHVVQQSNAPAGLSRMQPGSAQYNDLEQDADQVATGAVASLWGKSKLRGALPQLRSGLRLSMASCFSSTSKKTVTVTHTKLFGSTQSIDSGISFANTKVYNQANIEIKKGSEVTLDEAKTKAIVGNDLILDEYSDPAKPTAEEQALLKINTASGAIAGYYVKDFSSGTTAGEAFWPAVSSASAVVVGNQAIDQAFAHEIGHVLLNDGGHSVPDNTYLMYPSQGSSHTKLSPAEIKTMRSSSLAK